MWAEIITIGDEILIGQITDTNSQWIAQKLNEIGVSVFQISSVQDEQAHILEALAEAETRADIVLITGGLGPTKDDLTKHTLCHYFDDQLVFREEIAAHIKKLFRRINYPHTDSDLEQAMLPSKSRVLRNDRGTASGMWFDKNGKTFISMPGVPNEMKGLMQGHVLDGLREKYELPFILHKTVYTYGLGESRVALRLEDWEDRLPDFVKLAYLPSYGRLRLRLSAKGNSEELLKETIDALVGELNELLADIIVTEQEGSGLEQSLQQNFLSQRLTLSLAESCTGGAIAQKITRVPGSSGYFQGGLVAYQREVKQNLLGVDPSTIDQYSVVSAEVCREMALGCQKHFGTDYAVATTGNAGPGRDETDKEVGVVYVGIAGPSGVEVKEYFFGQPREKVIERTAMKALEMLRKEILKKPTNHL